MTSTPYKTVNSKGVTSWRVAWRYGGTRDGARQTAGGIALLDDAKRLRRAVEARAHFVYAKSDEVRSGAIYGKHDAPAAATGSPLWPVVAAEYFAQTSGQRESTRKIYERSMRLHLSRWDALPIDAITRADVVALVRDYDMVKGGRGHIHFVVAHAVLRYAKLHGYRSDDPSEGMRFESTAAVQHVFWEDDELALIVAAGRDVEPYFAQMVELVLGTGLRVGELVGCQRGDFTGLRTTHPHMTIARSVNRVSGKTVVGPTKSGKQRTIEIGPTVTAAIVARLREISPAADAWLWPTPGAHEPVTADYVRLAFARILDRAVELGLDPSRRGRVHDLRHTHASRLRERGEDLLVISKRLGHSSIIVTERHYASISKTSADRTYELLG